MSDKLTTHVLDTANGCPGQGIAIAQLNQMSQDEFTATFGEIWEETPEIASQAWYSKPFADLEIFRVWLPF